MYKFETPVENGEKARVLRYTPILCVCIEMHKNLVCIMITGKSLIVV